MSVIAWRLVASRPTAPPARSPGTYGQERGALAFAYRCTNADYAAWVYAATVAVYSRDGEVKWQQGVRDNSLCCSVYNALDRGANVQATVLS